jgi:hypothetical protein
MKIKYFVVPLGMFLLSGCCASNYSSEMKEVLEPMQKSWFLFIQKISVTLILMNEIFF